MTGILAIGAIRVLPVTAQNKSTHPPIVQKLAEKFGLDEDAVMEVFEETYAERQAMALTHFEDRLNNALAEGKITESQKQAIMDKHEEVQARMFDIRSQSTSKEQMHEQMADLRNEVTQWAESEGIDIPFFGLERGFGKNMGHARGQRMMFAN